MKYLKKFQTNTDYQAYKGGYVTPNVCYVEETEGLVFKPEIIENNTLQFPVYLVEGYNSPTDIMDYLYNKYGICGSIYSPVEIVEEIYLENFPEHSKANGKATRLRVVNQTAMWLYTENSMAAYYAVALTKYDDGTFLANTVFYD
jgi:hypothetical protein